MPLTSSRGGHLLIAVTAALVLAGYVLGPAARQAASAAVMHDTGHPVSLVRPACGPGWAREDHMPGQVAMFTSAGTEPLAPQELLGSQVVSGGYLYLSASHCADIAEATCIANGGNAVYLAG